MYVLKRDGRREEVHFDKITQRIKHLCWNLDETHVEPVKVSQRVVQGLYNGVTTTELDNLAAETAATMATIHPDYGILAARIAVSNLHKNTNESFSYNIAALHHYVDAATGKASLISKEVYDVIQRNAEKLDQAINYKRDFEFDYFGFKTLERSYLLRMQGQLAERPQQMFMRVAVGIHMDDIDAAIETYHLMSQKWFIHATPTLFNAGTPRPQLSSCFLLAMQDDSIEGIYSTLRQTALISQSAGGIGFSIHNVRAKGSYIKGTGGSSNGLVPMLQVFNTTARYVDQGGGKRKGAFAAYLEPWHPDVFEFLELKKNHGKEEMRARDLFYALWIPDLFMERVKSNDNWSLFCPNECPGLYTTYGSEFETLYRKYEKEGRAKRTIKAQELWFKILDSQIETGTPYMLYKDAVNKKSNQKNLGTIRSSNLCTEIMEYTDKDEVAVCNLASINLSKFVNTDKGIFEHEKLKEITKVVTRNLNKVIDVNYYPVPEARHSNMRHRPIGIGVQGLADAFLMLRLPFESEQARQLNKEIFESIYYGALEASAELAEQKGPYQTYIGSPASEGLLQFDLWNVEPSDRWNWYTLKAKIQKHGLRNSLLLAPMPTASTSQILGNNECFEPYTANIYTRRTLSGEFIVVNKHLLRDLISLGLWNDQFKNALIANNGSIQAIEGIPQNLKDLYKTAWEIKQKALIDMSADRGAFICQSQSLNVFMESADYKKLSSMHFYGWQQGLKTGMYYLRTRPAADPIKFTVDVSKLKKPQPAQQKAVKETTKPIANIPVEEDYTNQPELSLANISDARTRNQQVKDSAIAIKQEQTQQPEKLQPKLATNTSTVNFTTDDIAKINAANACSIDDPNCEACGS